MTASLAYRKNEAAILRGDVPEKYTRLVPFVPGQRILEVGSAEGVLALLLAKEGKHVTALEKTFSRHSASIALRDEWLMQGLLPSGAKTAHVHGDIAKAVKLIEPGAFDTVVAVRMIYYLGDELDEVFAEFAAKVPNVVLCGNGNRAARWRLGNPDAPLGEWNRYAAREGMIELLERHGYRIVKEGSVNKGDEVVVGRLEG